jgi:protein-tyrosine phosphatase
MAEGLLKELLKEAGISGVYVESAGTGAPDNAPPPRYAMIAMAEEGLDISSHRSRNLTRKMLAGADLILVMEQAHRKVIVHHLPELRKKVFLLKAFGTGGHSGEEVADPIGADLDFYRLCRDDLKKELLRIIPEIRKLAR